MDYLDNNKSLDYSDLGIDLFDHQEECIKSLNSEFIEGNRKRGMIVVPTGGGKTTIASTWIIKNILDKGYNVLWLSHRIVLLQQAKENFYKYLSYINPSYNLKNLVVISYKDSSWKNVKKETNLA